MTSEVQNQVFPSMLKQGNAAFRRKNYSAAIAYYKHALEESPELTSSILANLRIASDRQSHTFTYNPSSLLGELKLNSQATQFDSYYYLEQNPDVREAKVNAAEHYYNSGEREGRKPNAFFDPSFYLDINADVRAANISPFAHFCDHGSEEGRLGAARKINRIRSNNIKPLLFIGHDGIQAGSEVVLLEIIKWFYNHTTRRIKLLLLSPGPISSAYTDYAETYVLPGYVDDHVKSRDFLCENFEFVYVNTVVAGRIFQFLPELDLTLQGRIITHIHEMQNVIESYPDEMSGLLQHTDHWISASPRSTQALSNKYKIKSSEITTVPAFINPIYQKNEFKSFKAEARQTLAIAANAFVVVGCGTVYPRKGADLFIETARKLKALTSNDFQFVWIGDGPDLNRLQADLTAEELNYISFVGNRSDANKMLACADLFFMSSREDPFPLVVLEAAQHKIPAICFRPATGIVDFIEKDAGFILDKVNTDSAAAIINKALSSPGMLTALGDTAYEKLHNNYTSDVQTVKIFNAITANPKFTPAISVIVPFFNHVDFINERLDSIANQSIKDIEIIILDDASTDGTKPKLSKYCKKKGLKGYFNAVNSGSPFSQWSKGISLAKANIVWIAEGDDSCLPNMLSVLLPSFNDPLINIAAAKTITMDESSELDYHGLDSYMNQAYEARFENSFISDGFLEVNKQFGSVCTLVNASGLLIRKSSFGNSLDVAQSYKMAGDWRIYLECLKSGKLFYSTETLNYFRRHSQSQIHRLDGSEIYFRERAQITDFVVSNYFVEPKFLRRTFSVMDREWERFSHKHPHNILEDFYSKTDITAKAEFLSHNRHVAFYIHGMLFSKGGIERIAATLANHLASKGWDVTIYCRKFETDSPTYPLYERVQIVPIVDESSLSSSVVALRKHLLQSDIDVFVPMLSEWLFDPIIEAAQHTGIPIIASEHNDPWKIEELWWSKQERAACFRKADHIHLLLDSYRESLPISLRNRISIIPNGVQLRDLTVPVPQKERVIISIGRLEPQKRFDRLIKSVAGIKLELRSSGYRLDIYGEGGLKSELNALIKSLAVEDIISLKGRSENIEQVFLNARVFALGSDFEGLPMTLLEAYSYGLPAVGFRDCNGINEVIIDTKNGYLVNTNEEFGKAIIKLLDTEHQQTLGNVAHQSASAYSVEKCHAEWELLLENAIKNNCQPMISA